MVWNFVAVLRRHVRGICEERLQIFGRGISSAALKEVCRGLDRADLMCDRGCNPLVQLCLVFPARRAAAALIEAGSFRGTDELVLEAAVNGRADALVTCNLGHFAKGAARFGLRLARPVDVLEEMRQ